MSYERKEQIFLYHAYGLGIGGYLERHGQTLAIPSIVPIALSPVGGETEAKSGPWARAPEYDAPTSERGVRISVQGIAARIWTEENRREWITHSEMRVKGFNLCDRVEVGHMVTRLKSVHKKNHAEPRPRITFDGSGFW